MAVIPWIRSRRRILVAVSLALAVLGSVAWVGIDRWRPGGRPPTGVSIEHYTIDSAAVHRAEQQTALVPESGTPSEHRSLLVFLHGRSGNENSELSQSLYNAVLSTPDAPVMVFPDGGDSSYWHNRSTGQWDDYVMNEVIPAAITRYRLDPKRVAIGGISMGGFGALDLYRLHTQSFCAVGAHSPALWTKSGSTAAGAFDNAQDFQRHDVIAAANAGAYKGAALWIDAGTGDPFDPGDSAMAKALAHSATNVEVRRWPGKHDTAYWSSHYSDYIGFYAAALAHCPA